MGNSTFIGRKTELKALNSLLAKKTSNLIVIKGRRRIGKSRLAEEFAKNFSFYRFSGLAPSPGVSAQDQRNEFSLQLSQQTALPKLPSIADWTTLFSLLADKCKTGRMIILFDEISWMAHDDPTFLSKLKNAWDTQFKKNPKLILILCGSVSAWIEKNIMSSTGYFGRVSLDLTLSELSLRESNELLEVLGFRRSSLEKFILLSMTGGVPWYIEQINPRYSAIENIQALCFQKNSLLSKEYIHIFHDLFGKRSSIYQKITAALSVEDLDYDALSTKLAYAKSSALSEYLNDLILSGYLSQYNSWSFKTTQSLPKIVKYRLSDNFLRFYFRYMKSKLKMIEAGNYASVSPTSLPGWNSMLGLQFENLVLKNRELIHEALAINPADIIASGPYFQRGNTKKKGCQIDYLIQTKYKTITACEIKFSQNSIGASVIASVEDKIRKLATPRGFAVVPALIHASALSEGIYDADYFINIVDFREFLDE